MPEMKNNFQKGRMNKDLDERMVPNGEYRDALNVQVATSDGSDVGAMQTLKGNALLSNIDPGGQDDFRCIGSIVDDKNDKLYWLVSGTTRDIIVEYDYVLNVFAPVCVDKHAFSGRRALNFNSGNLVTGINIIDDIIFWTDNNSEPKRIHILRGKAGSLGGFNIHTNFMVRDVSHNAQPNDLVIAQTSSGSNVGIQEKHLTVIKKSPPAAPVLEMIDTTVGDWDGDGTVGGGELSAPVTNASSLTWLDGDGELVPIITISTSSGTDFHAGDYLSIFTIADNSVKVRAQVNSGGPIGYTVSVLSGNTEIAGETDLIVELEQDTSLFQFKFPRFAYRYKYEDGEYSTFSPFTQPAYLPGRFNYLPKEGYNLGMVNRVRQLVIKDFVHERLLPDDVISIDILYKESNSPNIYSVKTVKRRDIHPDPTQQVWDEWNAISKSEVLDSGLQLGDGWAGKTKGFLPITTEMIHATLPANQLLRPWDNVPRKALAQEIVGNRLVYGNYLQNYNLESTSTNESNLKVDLQIGVKSRSVGSNYPEEIEAGPNRLPMRYGPAKSVKSLRTYQVGVVYIDKYGRETPVFSEDKRGNIASGANEAVTQASVYVKKEVANQRNSLNVHLKNNPPGWATHFKLFIKETSNEYYNLAMDRWYDAEDGNIWLSFPSAERNKVDEDTFLILKKEHDNDNFVSEPAKYKIIAIENEAPRFIKLQNISMGGIVDDGTLLGQSAAGFPLEGGFFIYVATTAFEAAGWKESLINQDISQCFFRVKSSAGISLWYRLKQISFENTGGFYKIISGKVFEGDMAHTSPDGTFLNRISTCELQVMKKIPEDRAEFEGRFFVKILKDHTLIEKLKITSSSLDPNYIATASMRVQYINPITTQAPGGWNGYGTNKDRVSWSKRSDDYWARPGSSLPAGEGQDFWKMAGKVSAGGGSTNHSASSGWFIDAVEGFRPWKGSWSGKSIGVRTAPIDAPSGPCWGLYNSYQADWDAGEYPTMLQVMGLNTYNQGTWGYLGSSGSYDMKAPANVIATTGSANGGPVAAPVGIDAINGIINISYSGCNIEDDGSGSYPNSSNWNDLNTHWFDDSDKHVADEHFISKLMQPGTIWRWKEDPDQVLYKTKQITGLSTTSSPYTSSQWTNEAMDSDGKTGIMLFNYAIFTDYLIKNHKHSVTYCTCYICTGPYTKTDWKTDWTTRNISNHSASSWCCGGCVGCAAGGGWLLVQSSCSNTIGTGCGCSHSGTSGANNLALLSFYAQHYKFPMMTWDWSVSKNKRRRFRFAAEPLLDPTAQLGSGPHGYLPTNDPNFDPHFDASANAITSYPIGTVQAGTALPDPAPGIRPDGMYTGYLQPGGQWTWNNGSATSQEDNIPQYKRWSGDSVPITTPVPGSVTWEIVEQFTPDDDKFTSTNPAIWETEPKEDVGLDIYHEVGQIYPIYLDNNTIEQFVGAVHLDITKNSYVQCWDPPYAPGNNNSTIGLTTSTGKDIRVHAVYNNYVQLASTDGNILDETTPGHSGADVGSYLIFCRADGSTTEAHVGPNTYQSNGTWYELKGNWIENDVGVHNRMMSIPWFNCYSFGNGVESDRIRDDYNQVTIDNGPKASTTIEEPYLEDRRKTGFIWSGIYNSTSGVNNLNQFIQAEKITKDANPTYGSIQKLRVRDSDLVAFCEDRVLKVLANKDALYNADGDTNLVSTNRVIGNIKPFVGDYGISKNPESFASDSYRSYFSDTSRGAILRLSQDGLTPISDAGMRDYFSDILPTANSVIGSFDDNKKEYNITINTGSSKNPQYPAVTLSYSEATKGWVSFKSFIKENGVSLNNSYYTFKGGEIWQHHVNETRNNFYGQQYDSSVDVLFNQGPGVIKSYSALNYEGTQARVTQDINNNPDYYDNFPKDGWYVKEMISNAQELGEMEFWDKEDKWFSQIKGVATEWLNDGTAGNIDPREFSYQGIGNASSVWCPDCPTIVSWICGQIGESVMNCQQISGSSGYPTEQDCMNAGCGNVETWTCRAEGGSGHECFDPGDGSGQYSTHCECVNQSMCCDEGEAYFFTCPGISTFGSLVPGCMDDGITTDPWIIRSRPNGWVGPATNYDPNANVDYCDCVYLTASNWLCDNSNCTEVFDGSGQWATESLCLQNCEAPCGPLDEPPVNSIIVNAESESRSDCDNGIYTVLGGIQAGVINTQLYTAATEIPNWSISFSSVDNAGVTTLLFGPHTHSGQSSETLTNVLVPGDYIYTITNLDTGCSWNYSYVINCNIIPPPPSVTYDCVVIENIGSCLDPGDGSGVYTGANALYDCQNDPNSHCGQVVSGVGCTDPCACNWDQNATVDDGSCIYDCDAIDTLAVAEVAYLDANSALCQSDPNCNGVSTYEDYIDNYGGTGNPGTYAPVNVCYFPNNEFAIQTLIASPLKGIDVDMRHYNFWRNSCTGSMRHSLRIRHVDLDNWYGLGTTFFTWRDYIDSAIATGIITQPLDLINPVFGMIGGIQNFTNGSGYNIDFGEVRSIITAAFTAECAASQVTGQTSTNPACYTTALGVATDSACWAAVNGDHDDFASVNGPADCDRTFSTVCSPCTVPAGNPCTSGGNTSLGGGTLGTWDCCDNNFYNYNSNCVSDPMCDCDNSLCWNPSTNDVSWTGCCAPNSSNFGYIGPNGQTCAQDSMCTCDYSFCQ